MTHGYFDHLNDNDLLDAFEEYQRQQMGVYARPGVFSKAAQALEKNNPGKGSTLAAIDLLHTMAYKWYLNLRPVGKILAPDDEVWVIKYGEVKPARVVRVEEDAEDGRDYVYWIQPYDEDLDEPYPEKLLGTRFFRTEISANHYLDHEDPGEPDDSFWL